MTKLVCRVLDAENRLLGWCAHDAITRGDGYLRAASLVTVPITETGCAVVLSTHWADLNVETRVPLPDVLVSRGQSFAIFPANAPMVHAGNPPTQRLPPVTIQSAEVSVPVGQLGAVGLR